jgi:replicative DNA helicase
MSLSIVTNEQIILNILIKEPEHILRFDKNYFVSKTGRDLFIAIKNCFLDNFDLTDDNIIIFGNKINGSITKDLLQGLSKVECDVVAFEKHFKKLKEDYAKDRIQNKILKDILSEVSSKDSLNKEKLEDLKEEIVQGLELIEGKESLLISPEQLMDSYQVTLLKRMKGEDLYSTGDSLLDAHLTMGYAPGQFTCIFGGTAEGKSVLELNNIFKRINKQIPSLYISLENDRTMTMDRFLAIRLNMNYNLFYNNKNDFYENESLNDSIYKIVEDEGEKIKNIKLFYFVEEPSLSLGDVEILIKEAKRKMKVNYLVCTIDLLTMLEEFSTDISAGKIEECVNEIHRIARRQNVHIVGVVQANSENDYKPKTVKDVDKCRPNLKNIKNSKAFGERARAAISVFRPKVYAERFFGKDHPEVLAMDDILHARIEKQNMGGQNIDLKYLFVGEKFKLYKYIEKEKEG